MSGVRKEQTWSSPTTFLLATISCSVGLGNLWRFPYVAGENGGGAFVLVYLGFVFVVGVPLVMAELTIARRGQASPVSTIFNVAAEESRSPSWGAIGWMSSVAPLLALSFYAVVGGWSLTYLLEAARGRFVETSQQEAAQLFTDTLNSPVSMEIAATLMIAGVTIVVGSGLRRGIETVAKFMMPALAVLLVGLAIYANITGDSARALAFMFEADFSRLGPDAILIALGQSLFSIAVGTGALLAYGAYLPRSVSIGAAAWTIALSDTAAAILAGLLIFPIVFAAGFDAGEGPGLVFITLPVAFAQMPGSQIIAPLFFLTVFFAAFTSGIGMMEPFVSWAEEKQWLTRPRAAALTGFMVWLLSFAAVFSFNIWKDFTPLDMIPQLAGKTVFSILDYGVSNFILPLNALLIALFAGWAIKESTMQTDMGVQSRTGWLLWLWSIRIVAPVAIGAIFIFNLLT